MPQVWDAIVIGSGLGGLTAGALFARAGHRVLVLERNDTIGGAATTYLRHGRRFEASLHETTAPGMPGDPKTAIFRALGLDKTIELVPIDIFQQVRSPLLGEPFNLPHGLDRVTAALTARFPEAEAGIASFMAQIGRSLEAVALFSDRHDGTWWRGHAADLPLDLWALVRDMGASLSEVMRRHFGDDDLVKLVLAANLPYYSDDPDRFWWLGFAIAQGGYLAGGGHYIKGGSGRLTARLADIIREGGGAVQTGHRVTRVLTDAAGRATGVVVDGATSEIVATAPVIFANAAPAAVTPMLDAPLRDAFLARYARHRPSISVFEITLALSRPGATLGIDSYSTVLLPGWMETPGDFRAAGALLGAAPGGRMPPLIVIDYGQIDSGLAEDTPAPVSITGLDRLENWDSLSPADYGARKAAWIAAITARLDQEWPGFAAAVVTADMATARTMRDTLGTPGGAIMGFAPDAPQGLASLPVGVETSVPGLWLASAWAGMGGFTGAMNGGAMAARAALRALGESA